MILPDRVVARRHTRKSVEDYLPYETNGDRFRKWRTWEKATANAADAELQKHTRRNKLDNFLARFSG